MPNSTRQDLTQRGRTRLRMTLARRLTLAFAGMAALLAALAVLVQDRTLSRDLRRAAEQRLERAARASELLVSDHLRSLEERYRAISGTPQLRATVELADGPTLAYFAEQLREQQGAAAIEFRDARGRASARSGDPVLGVRARGQRTPGLLENAGALYGVVAVKLPTVGQPLGELVAVERIPSPLLARWSELCGATLTLDTPGTADELLWKRVRESDGAELWVEADLVVERAALAAARAKLALAGVAGLVVALVACAALARSLVQPIRAIHAGVDRVRAGDLVVRLGSQREDEIGDVARGIDLMVEHIRASHQELDARVVELQRSEEHLSTAQQLARVGSFELDLGSGRVDGTAEFWSLLGIGESAKCAPVEDVLARLHPLIAWMSLFGVHSLSRQQNGPA